jgi:type IV pilus assembly protein PilQ
MGQLLLVSRPCSSSPKGLLTALQAQITSGNAKILTDPTLVVQEGQTATVNLTQEVFGGLPVTDSNRSH